MNIRTRKYYLLALLMAVLSGCATVPGDLIRTPRVELQDVRVIGLGFKSQTFLLSFDVANPNPFPLPISNVSYGVKLDGQRFASGEAACAITVPADGDAQFAISVDLNLLQTAPQLLSIVRQGVRQDISYELEGHLALDIPLTAPVRYRSSGTIRLGSESF